MADSQRIWCWPNVVLAHPYILWANVVTQGLVCMFFVWEQTRRRSSQRTRASGIIPRHGRQTNTEQHVPEYLHSHIALSNSLVQKPTIFNPTVFPIICAFQNTAEAIMQPSSMRPELTNSRKTGWLQLGLAVASNGIIQRSGVEHASFVPSVELNNGTA
jgi:hypothetical protein